MPRRPPAIIFLCHTEPAGSGEHPRWVRPWIMLAPRAAGARRRLRSSRFGIPSFRRCPGNDSGVCSCRETERQPSSRRWKCGNLAPWARFPRGGGNGGKPRWGFPRFPRPRHFHGLKERPARWPAHCLGLHMGDPQPTVAAVLVRQLRGPHWSRWPWWSSRSSMAPTAAASPSSLPQSSTGRFEVSRVLARS